MDSLTDVRAIAGPDYERSIIPQERKKYLVRHDEKAVHYEVVATQAPQSKPLESGHAPVNGIDMYYEVHGRRDGVPLVLLHGGGSTIEVTFSRALPVVGAPTLIVLGDRDIVRPEHAVELTRLIPGARLLILPGGHGDYLGEAVMTQKDTAYPELTARLIEEFLNSRSG
jgi:pimeloyl-ACP methyl ester carboxylesterase